MFRGSSRFMVTVKCRVRRRVMVRGRSGSRVGFMVMGRRLGLGLGVGLWLKV